MDEYIREFMRHNDSKIGIRVLHGHPWPRYVIGSGEKFWTGTGWTTDCRQSLVFADIDAFRRELFRLRCEEEQQS